MAIEPKQEAIVCCGTCTWWEEKTGVYMSDTGRQGTCTSDKVITSSAGTSESNWCFNYNAKQEKSYAYFTTRMPCI